MREWLDRFSAPTLPGLNEAVEAVCGLDASISETASDAWQRIEGPELDLAWLSGLSSRFWPGGSDPASAVADLRSEGASAATPAKWGSTVGKSGLTWELFFSNSGHDWSGEIDMGGLVRFLRGRYPDKTVPNVAADTRLPADTIKKWLSLAAAPNGRAMLVLACVYGPEVLVAVLRHPPGWLVSTARAAEQARLEAELARLRAKLARGVP